MNENAHPKPDDKYIITEHELFLFEAAGFWDRNERIYIAKLVRSRKVDKVTVHVCDEP